MADYVCNIERKVCECFDDMITELLTNWEAYKHYKDEEELFKKEGFMFVKSDIRQDFYHHDRFNLEREHSDFAQHFDYICDVFNKYRNGLVWVKNDSKQIPIDTVDMNDRSSYDYSLINCIYEALIRIKIDELLREEFKALGLDVDEYREPEELRKNETYNKHKFSGRKINEGRKTTMKHYGRKMNEGMSKYKLNEFYKLIQDFKKSIRKAMDTYKNIYWEFETTPYGATLNKNYSSMSSPINEAYNLLKQIYNDEIKNVDTATTLDSSVKEWYMGEYPTDNLGKKIDYDVTFNDIYDLLQKRKDVYKYLADDSIVRERVFDELATLKEIDYDEIYNLWLETEEDDDDDDD